MALEVQIRIWQHFGVGIVGGGCAPIGLMFGANARFEGHPSQHLFVSVGLGPLVSTSGTLQGALFVQGDLALSLRFTTNAALTLGPVLAVGANHVGTPRCYVDTCGQWSEPGSFVFLLRAGFGFAF